MSDLRRQLETARDDYRAARYPGDLAAELLPPPRREQSDTPLAMRWVIAGSLISGLAAAVALWIGLQPGASAPTHPTHPLVAATTNAVDVDIVVDAYVDNLRGLDAIDPTGAALTDVSDAAAFPDHLPLVPSAGEEMSSSPIAPGELGAMPSMPSLDFNFSG